MESNKPPNGHERHMLFLSHATPEDNSFARWLALQLANEGYPVWCDLTKLLGGEDFWKDIQEAIRKRSIRFLFVLSRSSNTKDGTLQELACAKAVAAQVRLEIRDFIIALKIDDLPYSEVDIEIQRLNHISFTGSWASGLNQLLKKLADDNVPKDPRFNPDSVSSWWRSQSEFSAVQGVVDEPEVELSNWYGIERFPGTVWCHNVSRRSTGKLDFDISGLPYPAAKATDLSFLSFAKADELSDFLDKSIYIQSSVEIYVSDILVRSYPLSRHVVNMLRQGWESAVEKSGFSVQRVAPRPSRFYFEKDKIPNDRIFFEGVNGKRSYRDVVGYATKRGVLRYWHYAISGKPELSPYPHIVIRGHVLFSDSGAALWTDSDKSAKARRNQCKGWWNDEWRDRMLAVMSQLCGKNSFIEIPMSSDKTVTLRGYPDTFECPVSYVGEQVIDAELDDYFEDDDEEDDEIETEEVDHAESSS
jgi:TIR domain